MSELVYSNAGRTISISTTVQNSDLNLAGFQGLSYTTASNVGSIGPYGISTNVISYDTLDTLVTRKAKGITNAGDPEIEAARVSDDPGQIAFSAAGAPGVFDNYAFKVTNQDGSVDYLRGLVMGPNRPNGRNEDFDLVVWTIGLNQVPVNEPASA